MDNIKIYVAEIEWGGVDWIGLARIREKWKALINAVMHLLVHNMIGNCQVTAQLWALE
jgi:hypothetical protein